MKGIYEFFWDCGRMGEVSGVFIADSVSVKNLIGKDIYFGEILGKHSEVYGRIDEGDIKLKTDNQEFIRQFEDILGEGWGTGYNPFDYFNDDHEEEEDDA